MKALCAGLPVVISYNERGTFRLSDTVLETEESGNHAVNITGVEMIGGVPLFVT